MTLTLQHNAPDLVRQKLKNVPSIVLRRYISFLGDETIDSLEIREKYSWQIRFVGDFRAHREPGVLAPSIFAGSPDIFPGYEGKCKSRQ